MKDFTRAVQRKIDNDDDWETIKTGDPDDPVVFRIQTPDPSQFAVVIGTLEGFGTEMQQASAAMAFLMSIIHPEDRPGVNQALMDRNYPFVLSPGPKDDPETPNVIDILFELVEDWSGRPTQPAVASSGSRQRTGRTSTAPARSKGSTRSTSRQTGSST